MRHGSITRKISAAKAISRVLRRRFVAISSKPLSLFLPLSKSGIPLRPRYPKGELRPKGTAGMRGLVVLLLLGLAAKPCVVEGARLIAWGHHQNDSRVDFEDAAPIGPPFAPGLFYWWGDEDYEYEAETYDLLTQASGVPVTGKGSLWPRRGRPINSLWHSSDGPVSAKGMSLFEVAAAVAAEANGGKDGEDEAGLAEAAAVWERRSSEDALNGGKSSSSPSSSPGLRFMGKPAVVGVIFSCSTDEEVQFPAFAQETLGDVVTRIVRRLPRSAHYKMSVIGKGVVGLPGDLGGLPLSLTLSDMGFTDGSGIAIAGTSPHESKWPAYECVKHPLEAYLAHRPWPPCSNFARRDPLNGLTVGASDASGNGALSGPEADNKPSNVVVVLLSDGERVCYNKHALAHHFKSSDVEPTQGGNVDRVFKAQVKASLLMDVAFMTLYLNEGQYEAQGMSE